MKTILFLYTATYPYGKGETFIENEIGVLCEEFDKVYIVPHNAASELVRDVPNNAEVVPVYGDRLPYTGYSSNRIIKSSFLRILKIVMAEFYGTRKKAYFLSRLRYWSVVAGKAVHDANLLSSKFKSSELKSGVHYTFWNNEWGIALANLKARNMIAAFVSRSGGFDIYDERHPGNYLPFRNYVYKHIKSVFPNSKMGEQYIKNLNIYPEKVECQYWGTMDHGLCESSEDSTIRVISVSNLIPLKRVHLIIELLSGVSAKIEWTHFGDGVLMDEILEQASRISSERFSFNFMGLRSNAEVIKFYKCNPVDFFITTSETEGLPVSIQEAISFGVPVIATNVGGMAEVVKPSFGLLLEPNFDKNSTIKLVDDFIANRKKAQRIEARNHWEKNFNAEKQYRKFCSVLKQ